MLGLKTRIIKPSRQQMDFYKRLLSILVTTMSLGMYGNQLLSTVPGRRWLLFSGDGMRERTPDWFLLLPRLSKGSSFSVGCSPCEEAGRGLEPCLLRGQWWVRHEGLFWKLYHCWWLSEAGGCAKGQDLISIHSLWLLLNHFAGLRALNKIFGCI